MKLFKQTILYFVIAFLFVISSYHFNTNPILHFMKSYQITSINLLCSGSPSQNVDTHST